MDIEHDLKKHLQYLSAETRRDNENYRETIDILFKLHTYILANLTNIESFVKLDFATDCAFLKVWRYESVRLFLFNLGWRQENNLLVLKNPENLQIGVDVLWSFVESENDLNSVKNTSKSEPKLIENLKNNLDLDNDDGSSIGFSYEHSEFLREEYTDSETSFCSESSIDESNIDESNIDVSITPTKLNSLENASSRNSTDLKKEVVSQQLACQTSYSVPIPIKPFLNVAFFMQTALDAVVPLTGPVFSQSGNLISQIYNSTKQMLSGVGESASSAVSGLGTMSAITISPGPQNSFNISSPNLFGSTAINIKSDHNNTILNLITDNVSTDAGPSKSDGSVNYSKNCCSQCYMHNRK